MRMFCLVPLPSLGQLRLVVMDPLQDLLCRRGELAFNLFFNKKVL